jgi:urease accessory protein
LESQRAAASRLVPLGQTEARRIALALSAEAEAALDRAESVGDREIGSNLAGLAILSASHEAQPSRLFRS